MTRANTQSDRDLAIITALSRAGGAAPLRRVIEMTEMNRSTVYRHLSRLVAAGAVAREAAGYALPADESLPGDAATLVGLLEGASLGAHLTGFHILGHLMQQYVADIPLVVYADPIALWQVRELLAEGGFVVVDARQPSHYVEATAPIVVLRAQSAVTASRLGVIQNRALAEKAWVDMTYESRQGTVPISMYDCGQMLGAGVRSRLLDRKRVQSIARARNLTGLASVLSGSHTTKWGAALLAGEASETPA